MDLQQQMDSLNRLCPCCGTDPENKPFSLFCPNMELVDLGEGYVLLFKMMIYFGILSLCFYGINIYKIVANFKGNVCLNSAVEIQGSDLKRFSSENLPPCHSDWVNPHSIANYGLKDQDLIERALMVAFLAVFWVAMGFVYRKILDICRDIDEANDTPCDWTLMFTNIPLAHDETTIAKNLLLEPKLANLKNIQIKKISIAYNLDEYLKLSDQIAEKKKKVKKLQFTESKSKSHTSLPELQELKSNHPSKEILQGDQICTLI